MAKTCVIAEKPSVGKDIARVLGCRPCGGYSEGAVYVVTWALGHLVELAEPEAYDPKYKKWELDSLPIMPEKLKTRIIPQSSKQFATVKAQLSRADVGDVVIATDAGREGELVARWILEKAGCKKPVKRLWISSVTDKAIKDGFNNLQTGRKYELLADSAKARAEADWLVGINATRAMTTRFNAQLSCGRVQTPTLSMINRREEDIRAFVSRPYYGLSARVLAGGVGFNVTYTDREGGTRFSDEAKAQAVLERLKDAKDAVVKEIIKKPGKKNPPALYDLTELQRDASKRYALSPKETLSICQALYERHKVLTYPRTDSRALPTDVRGTLTERLRAVSVGSWRAITAGILKKALSLAPGVIDDAKVSDHHALIPTEQTPDFADFSQTERRIYELVVNRFLCVFLPPMEYETVSLKATIGAGGDIFIAKGTTIKNPGYTIVGGAFEDDEDEAANDDDDTPRKAQLPPLKNGDKLKIESIKITSGKTKPPAAFTEATLLSAMENPAKFLEEKDAALSKALTATGGLGTVATRADIIEKLYDTFVIEKISGRVYTTAKGRELLKLAPTTLRSPALTGEWELKLSRIAEGNLTKEKFVTEIRKYAKDVIADIKGSTDTFRHDNLTNKQCPVCGMFMLEVTGKKGKMLVCQDRECAGRVSLSFHTRTQCPRCRKFLEVVGEDDKKKAVCPACGFNERYEVFEKRMAEAANRVTSKQAEDIMAKRRQEEKAPPNNPFAALKGMLEEKR